MSYKPRQDYFSDSGSSSRSTYAPKSNYFNSSYDATHPKNLAKEITKQQNQRDNQKEEQRQQAKQSAFSKIKNSVVRFGKEAAQDVGNSVNQLGKQVTSATAGNSNLNRQNQNVDAVAKSNQQAHDAFKQGKISKDQYTKILKSGGESLRSSQSSTTDTQQGTSTKHTAGAILSLASLFATPELKGAGVVAKKVAPKLAEKIIQKTTEKSVTGLAARAGIEGAKLAPSGAAYGVGDSLQKDKTLKDTAKTVAIDTLAAGGLGAAGKVAGETIGKAAQTGRMKLGKTVEKPQLPTDVVEVLGADEARLTAQKLATASSPEVADKIIMDTQAKVDQVKSEAAAQQRVVGEKSTDDTVLPKESKALVEETGDKTIDNHPKKQIVEMTPDEYLKQAFEATDGKLGGSFDSWLSSNRHDAQVAKDYAKAMADGDKFPIPYIDKARGMQDGRNRAIAAKLNGSKTIKVAIIPRRTPSENVSYLQKELENTTSSYMKYQLQKKLDIAKNLVTKESKQIAKTTMKPKVESPKNTEMNSRVYVRLKAEHPELADDLSYEGVNLKNEAEKAVDLIAKDKQKAFDIAMGAEQSSEHLSAAVNIAMFEKAMDEGNYDLASRLVKNRSLAQTRRGQELVAEKGSVTDNSTSRYVKELIATKLEKVGKQYLGDVRDKLGKTSSKERATRAIDKEVTKLEKQVRGGKLDVKTALGLLDKASCL